MWKSVKDISNNCQTFSREKNGELEEIKAPITIGDNRYTIDGVLSNSGGFGVVFTAKDSILLDRRVLIKARKYAKERLFKYELNSERERRIEEIRRDTIFEYEALGAFKKNNESRMPNVNNIVFGYCPELHGPHTTIDNTTFYYENEEVYNSEPYLVMQVIEGENLTDYAERCRNTFSKPMWEIKVLEITKEITTILRDIHRKQKTENGALAYHIYRDLKPDNIMITGGQYLTLLDFGGIQLVKQNAKREFKTNLDGYGAKYIGTPGYQAPEAAKVSYMLSELDQRVDIYTLGATMFNLLVGGDIVNSIDPKTELLQLNKLDGLCSDVTREVIEKCLQPDRDNRYNTMQEVLNKVVKDCFTQSKAYWREKASEVGAV